MKPGWGILGCPTLVMYLAIITFLVLNYTLW